mmetsp:Transcript_9955/g.20586  ORF Transcript_9955/g.20586 Transcript_9955/m.20586 type:complete len:83 (-) Transcript_9955:870-1118(-)
MPDWTTRGRSDKVLGRMKGSEKYVLTTGSLVTFLVRMMKASSTKGGRNPSARKAQWCRGHMRNGVVVEERCTTTTDRATGIG